MSVVAVTHNKNIERSIEEALGRLELDSLIRGRVVAVKPNETWASRKDTTAVTQPESLRAVLQYVKRFEPARLIVSGGAGAAETADVFRIVGLMDVVEAEGAEFVDHNRPPFAEVDLDYGPQRSIMVHRRVLDYQTLIVLSQLKVHASATVTLAYKNIGMSYPAADYYGHPREKRVHQHAFFEDLHAFIVGVVKRFPISLAVTVGHPAMVGTGPIGGKTADTGLTIASTDALAADVVAARILGFKLMAVRHLWQAAQLGLGEGEISNMEFPALTVKKATEMFSAAMYGKKIEVG